MLYSRMEAYVVKLSRYSPSIWISNPSLEGGAGASAGFTRTQPRIRRPRQHHRTPKGQFGPTDSPSLIITIIHPSGHPRR
ncbi:unnamed protein product [Sympodiomycopsis kandeliae]